MISTCICNWDKVAGTIGLYVQIKEQTFNIHYRITETDKHNQILIRIKNRAIIRYLEMTSFGCKTKQRYLEILKIKQTLREKIM